MNNAFSNLPAPRAPQKSGPGGLDSRVETLAKLCQYLDERYNKLIGQFEEKAKAQEERERAAEEDRLRSLLEPYVAEVKGLVEALRLPPKLPQDLPAKLRRMLTYVLQKGLDKGEGINRLEQRIRDTANYYQKKYMRESAARPLPGFLQHAFKRIIQIGFINGVPVSQMEKQIRKKAALYSEKRQLFYGERR